MARFLHHFCGLPGTALQFALIIGYGLLAMAEVQISFTLYLAIVSVLLVYTAVWGLAHLYRLTSKHKYYRYSPH